MATKEELIKKYKEKLLWIINPDGSEEWNDIGFDSPPEGYENKTVTEFLEMEGEFDEGQQTEKACIEEFLEDLENIDK